MKNLRRNLIISLAGSCLFTLLSAAGAFNWLDCWAQDTLFQKASAPNPNIVVIGVDEAALEQIGPYNTWDRHVMATALEALNKDPAKKPAVVAVDALYIGETNKIADDHLAKAASDLGNVVVACDAVFGTGYEDIGAGTIRINTQAVMNFEEPYGALKEVTSQGHINAMYDVDGILRHGLLYFDVNGERKYSMPYTVAAKFLESQGKEAPLPPTDSRGHFYVDFNAKPGGFYDHVSIADLIGGKVPTDYFAGKIVFIGPYASGLQDAYFTPIDRAGQMYGVEFQANVVSQILRGAYKKEAPDLAQLIILFIICALATFLFLNTKLLISSVSAVVLIVLGISASVVLYSNGTIIHPLWIPLGVFLFYLVSIAVRYVTAAMEKRAITKTFERYVAPEIVSEIMKEGTENIGLGGKTCDIAVLFVDVRGFTTMSERLDPEKVVFILNKYLTMASAAVEAHKGTLDKFVGDAMMAFWGAPLPQEDAVYNAVCTARDIVEGAARVSEELKDEIGEELRVGVGVHYGPAVVGNMGSERHMDYTAIGDTVNTSARLEANAPGGCVYISRAVCDQLGDRITYTSLGDTVKLKGKAEGFEVLKLESVV